MFGFFLIHQLLHQPCLSSSPIAGLVWSYYQFSHSSHFSGEQATPTAMITIDTCKMKVADYMSKYRILAIETFMHGRSEKYTWWRCHKWHLSSKHGLRVELFSQKACLTSSPTPAPTPTPTLGIVTLYASDTSRTWRFFMKSRQLAVWWVCSVTQCWVFCTSSYLCDECV